ncbi:MAG: hypothetical protein E7310_01560 [Clostridiales bacterium]|nr:hypothetical protein [Clostridiales bacterium]
MRDKKLQNGLIVTIILTICGIFCAQVLLKTMDGNKITYAEPDTTIEIIEEIIEKQVVRQNTPIPAKKENAGKELILIDKSGSMKEFVNAVYSENVQFFKNNELWSFDTEVSKNEIDITSIEFGGDTNVFKAINEAAKAKYDTVWLCSDLEHNTGELKLLDEAKEMTIIVYSPKPLSEKANLALETLKEANDVRVITIS